MNILDLNLRWTPSDSVREAENRDGAVLLDIRHRVCLFMNPIEVQVWRRLSSNKSVGQIVVYLLGRFPEVSREQLQNDVLQFVDGLRRTGVLRSHKETHTEQSWYRFRQPLSLLRRVGRSVLVRCSRIQHLVVWRALVGFLLFDLFRLGKDFNKVQAVVKNWPIAMCTANPDAVNQVCNAIKYARVWYPKYVLCSQRSAVTTCLLRSCGVNAQMVIGAQPIPCKAHAWTEVEGVPVNERKDVHRRYLVWERC
jgi:hypothetical protein